MKELLEKADIKGLNIWVIHKLLAKYGWEIFVYDPTPFGKGINEWYMKNNKRAIEQALIEIDFLV